MALYGLVWPSNRFLPCNVRGFDVDYSTAEIRAFNTTLQVANASFLIIPKVNDS